MYVGWFACILLGRAGWGWLSVVFPIAVWLFYVRAAKPERTTLLKMFMICLLGLVSDNSVLSRGMIEFNPVSTPLVPVWMFSLWFLFGPSFPILKKVFQRRYFLAALAGAVFGPLSYKSGAQFGVMQMNSQWTFLYYVIFWAIFFPLSLYWLDYQREELPRERSNENT